MKIVLICSSGISSGYFARKIEKALNESSSEKNSLDAMGYLMFLKRDISCDGVLIGPIGPENISRVTAKCDQEKVPYAVIENEEYISMDTDQILKKISCLNNVKQERREADE